jgi:ribosomal protein S18 acetylase RimI-like enzyme
VSPPAAAVRTAGPDDAERLALVGRATFLETFAGVLDADAILGHCERQHAPDLYAAWLGDGRSRLWLAEAETGGAPVGYAVLAPAELPRPEPTQADAELKRIYLLGRFQGGGLGRRLMEAALGAAREDGYARLLLGVYAGNAPALAFYRRSGFEVVGERRFTVGPRTYEDLVLSTPLDVATR